MSNHESFAARSSRSPKGYGRDYLGLPPVEVAQAEHDAEWRELSAKWVREGLNAGGWPSMEEPVITSPKGGISRDPLK